jgi:hypothetical protein
MSAQRTIALAIEKKKEMTKNSVNSGVFLFLQQEYFTFNMMQTRFFIKTTACFLSAFLLGGYNSKAQAIKTRYAIETTFDKKVPVAYEELFGSLVLNSVSGDITFTTDLADIKTGDKRTDSLLAGQENIPFVFQAGLPQGLSGVVNAENDDKFHKIVGAITVNGSSFPLEAEMRVNNLINRSDLSKALLDLRFEIDPKVVLIPILSDYFKNILLFQVSDGIINQNR